MFKGKVVVITGSTQGIGKRTAELLALRGAKLVINSRSEEKVKQVVDSFKSKGHDVIGIHGNVSDYNFCARMKDYVIEQFGRIDFLINNAALAAKGTLADSTPDVLEQVLKVNILGSLYPTKAFMPELIKTKGGVLFISSLAGIIGLPGYGAYSGTKKSIVSWAETLKNEFATDGVFVAVNFPGFTENDVNKKIMLSNGEEIILKKRTDVKVDPLDKTVKNIIRQIEKRKFRSFSSFRGRFVEFMYRLSPSLSIFILKKNRNKIMSMD